MVTMSSLQLPTIPAAATIKVSDLEACKFRGIPIITLLFELARRSFADQFEVSLSALSLSIISDANRSR
jgi:hypothetical protein